MTVQTYISAVRSAATAQGKAWEVSLADLTGANEGTVTKYFEAASAILVEAKVPKDDPRRVMVRNHKSALLGLLKRGGKIEKGLGKSKVEADNREARKGAKGPDDKDAAKPGAIKANMATAAEYILTNWDKVTEAERMEAIRPLGNRITEWYAELRDRHEKSQQKKSA